MLLGIKHFRPSAATITFYAQIVEEKKSAVESFSAQNKKKKA